MSYAARIQQAGFTLEVENGHLCIKPFSKLSPEQLEFLRRHRDQIIAELLAANGDIDSAPEARGGAPKAGSDRTLGGTSPTPDDAVLADILARACDGLDLEPQDLWRYLSREDIAAIRRNPEAEWPALRCCAEIWSRRPPAVIEEHGLPMPGIGS